MVPKSATAVDPKTGGFRNHHTRLFSDQVDPKRVCKCLFESMIHVSGDAACDDHALVVVAKDVVPSDH
jgi:hypothetical protein